MAKVDYNYPIEALHGKVKRTHSVGFAMRKETGAKYTQTYTHTLSVQARRKAKCNRSSQPPSEPPALEWRTLRSKLQT